MYAIQAIMPNTEKLFMYVQRGQWHNVTPSSTGFVKKEFQKQLQDLQMDEKDCKELKLMIEYAEMGKYTEAKNIMNEAHKQYQDMVSLTMDRRQGPPYSPRQTSRQGSRQASRQASRQSSRHGLQNLNNAEQGNRDIYTPNYNKNQETYRDSPRRLETPRSPLKDQNQERTTYRGREAPQSPFKEQNRMFQGRETPPRSPVKNQQYSNQDRMETPRSPMKNNPQNARYNRDRMDTPQSPMKNNQQTSRYNQDRASQLGTPRSPLKQTNTNNQDYDSEEERKDIEQRHKENYQILRVHSPDKKYFGPRNNQYETPRTQPDQSARGRSPNVDRDHPLYKHGDHDQQASHTDILGLDFGDKDKDKARDSTYRMSFPKYDIESLERQDKLRYRSNFNSLAERETWFRDNVTLSEGESRNTSGVRRSPNKRAIETPDTNPHNATELAKRFRELYVKEWQDAYDEICKTYGPEKTVRHLLWIITESSLIANEIGSAQMRDLEKSAFGVMRTPGPDKEHPAESSMPRNVGEAIPKSRTLLMRYRRQTADLSIPYVKEECRNKISDTLVEQSQFPRTLFSKNSRLVAYINKCAELTWLLCVQDPPIVLEYVTKRQEGARFNNDLYTQYTKPGMSYDFGVWPLLRQANGGPIISKGIAQGI